MGEFVDRDSFTHKQDHDHIWVQSNIVLMSDNKIRSPAVQKLPVFSAWKPWEAHGRTV